MKITTSARILTVAALSAVGSGRVLAFQAHRVSASAPPAVSPASPPSTTPAKSPQAPPTAPAASKYDELTGENWEHDAKNQTGSCDNFKYLDPSSNTTVTGPHAIYNDDKKILNAIGDLTLDDDKHHVTASKADVYYGKKKLAVLDGNVIIVLKPSQGQGQVNAAQPAGGSADNASPDVKSERGRGGTITCDHVEDYYKKKFVVMTGHLVFTQQIKEKDHTVTRTMTAEHGEYDGKAEKLHLFAPVHFSDTDGQKFDPEQDVYVGTREGEEDISSKGHFKLLMIHKEDDNSDDDDSASDAKAALKGTTPPLPAPAKPDGPGKLPQR